MMTDSEKKTHALQLAREDVLYFHQKSTDTILALMDQYKNDEKYVDMLMGDLKALLNKGLFPAEEIVNRAKVLYAFYDKV
jgi:hypothetical protein